MSQAATLPEPWHEPWPAEGLESVQSCPVCGDGRRELLYAELVDNVFRVAPGKWTLWRCAGCRSAYLDPRPTIETIQLAYANYYTHRAISEDKPEYASLTPLRKLRRRLVNGYTNRRFGTRAAPASALGPVVLSLSWRHRRIVSCAYRHLPKPPRGGGTILEVGFGSGEYLKVAAECGWTVKGLDSDPAVVRAALERGFSVEQGGIEDVKDSLSSFDVIMMNHVIEHIHHPIQALECAFSLLRPGGILYIETPNIESMGHERFGRHWRGLEAPRHLMIFNPRALHEALRQAGFERTSWRARANPITSITLASVASCENRINTDEMAVQGSDRRFVRKASLVQSLFPFVREYITMTAARR